MQVLVHLKGTGQVIRLINTCKETGDYMVL